MGGVRYRIQKLPHFYEYLLDKYMVVAGQIFSSNMSNRLPEEMQMRGVQYRSPVTTDTDRSKYFVLHAFACFLEDDLN